jgi:hypothetical protein
MTNSVILQETLGQRKGLCSSIGVQIKPLQPRWLWWWGSQETKLSPYAYGRLFQIKYKSSKRLQFKTEENDTFVWPNGKLQDALCWSCYYNEAEISVSVNVGLHSTSSADTNFARMVNWKLSNIALVGWTTGHSMPPAQLVTSKCPLLNLFDNLMPRTRYSHKETKKIPCPSTVTITHLVATIVTY